MIDSWGYQLSNIKYLLSKHHDKAVTVRVNSFGGDVNQAMMISQALSDHGNVTVHLLGFNASAATWLVFGAKRVEIADDGLWFCHRSTMTVDIWKDMNVNDLEATIKELESQKKSQEAIDLMIAQKYVNFAQTRGKKMDIESAIALMNEERWLAASEVLDKGFADALIKGAKSVTKDAYDFAVSNCASLHLPAVPAREEKKTVVQKMKDFLFGEKPESEDPIEKPSINNKTTIIMKKNYVSVNALLKVEGIEVAENKATLDEQQLQTIEDALAEAAKLKNDVAAALAELDKVSDKVKAIDGLKNKVLALISIVDRVPMAVPADAGKTPGPKDDEQTKLDELEKHAVDPINAEAKNLL